MFVFKVLRIPTYPWVFPSFYCWERSIEVFGSEIWNVCEKSSVLLRVMTEQYWKEVWADWFCDVWKQCLMGFTKCPGILCSKMWTGCIGREFRRHKAWEEPPIKARSNTSTMGNHRILEWVGRDLKDYLCSTPCHEQWHLPTRSSPIQAGLKHFQAWGSHSFSGSKPHCLRGDMHGTGASGALSQPGECESTFLVNYSSLLNNPLEYLECGHPQSHSQNTSNFHSAQWVWSVESDILKVFKWTNQISCRRFLKWN